MQLDVVQFLQDYGIEFVTVGPNVKKGNINVACPWCGDDPSHHMGIEPSKGWYGCWRNTAHRGKNIAKLLAAISPLSYSEVARLVGKAPPLDTSDIEALADGSFFTEMEEGVPIKVEHLVLPYNFRKLRYYDLAFPAKGFFDYVMRRGFTHEEAGRICGVFDLHYCVSGWWKERIIIPIYMNKELVTWTARSIYVNPEISYLSLDADSSVMNVKHCLYNYDSAYNTGGETLFLVEGPGDVWKMDLVARTKQCRAVGLFNMSCEEEQLEWVENLVTRFDRLVILLDRNELVAGNALLDKLAYLPKEVLLGELPKGVKDPGKLSRRQAIRLCEEYENVVV